MNEREKLGAMRLITAVQAARVARARFALDEANAALIVAAARAREGRQRLDTAIDGWQSTLAATCPDPMHLVRTGDWLVAQQSRLKADELDESIASHRCDSTTAMLAETMARHEVSIKLTDGLTRSVLKTEAERRQIDADDRYRMRRHTCPMQ